MTIFLLLHEGDAHAIIILLIYGTPLALFKRVSRSLSCTTRGVEGIVETGLTRIPVILAAMLDRADLLLEILPFEVPLLRLYAFLCTTFDIIASAVAICST